MKPHSLSSWIFAFSMQVFQNHVFSGLTDPQKKRSTERNRKSRKVALPFSLFLKDGQTGRQESKTLISGTGGGLRGGVRGERGT